jgi:hypothetical protein
MMNWKGSGRSGPDITKGITLKFVWRDFGKPRRS